MKQFTLQLLGHIIALLLVATLVIWGIGYLFSALEAVLITYQNIGEEYDTFQVKCASFCDKRVESVISSEEVVEVNSKVSPDVTAVNSNPAPRTFENQEMLDYVIMCESSGRHEGIWGAENEYGTLQYKSETWDYLSEKYYYVGEWKNREDQINLFLLTTIEDKRIHWTCFNRWEQAGRFGL